MSPGPRDQPRESKRDIEATVANVEAMPPVPHFCAYPIFACYDGNKMSPRLSQMTTIWIMTTTAAPVRTTVPVSTDVPTPGIGAGRPILGTDTGATLQVPDTGAALPVLEIEIFVLLVPGNHTQGLELMIGSLVMSNPSGAEVSSTGPEKMITTSGPACLSVVPDAVKLEACL